MKKNAQYEVNFAANTIIVTKKFREAASVIGTPEFNTMVELRKLNMPITERVVKRTRSEERWTYARMMDYIRNTEDASLHMEDYRTLKDAVGYMKVWAWFKKTFPNYNAVPELNEDHKIVVTPADYRSDECVAENNDAVIAKIA